MIEMYCRERGFVGQDRISYENPFYCRGIVFQVLPILLLISRAVTYGAMSSSTSGIVVVGCVSDAAFHRCCRMVKVLNDAGLSAKVSAPLFDTQYEEYLREKKTHVGGSIFEVCTAEIHVPSHRLLPQMYVFEKLSNFTGCSKGNVASTEIYQAGMHISTTMISSWSTRHPAGRPLCHASKPALLCLF